MLLFDMQACEKRDTALRWWFLRQRVRHFAYTCKSKTRDADHCTKGRQGGDGSLTVPERIGMIHATPNLSFE